MNRKIFAFLFILIALLSSQSHSEVRVILDEDFYWVTKKGADEVLERVKAAGFNVFVPCVWHGRGVTWNSKFKFREPRWEKVRKTGHDPLEYLITKAHSMGIEVHPWFTVSLRQREFLSEYYDDGTPESSFDMHKPEFREFITSLVAEVVENYQVDGINLDYIRTRGNCDSDYCVKNYAEHGFGDLKNDLSVLKMGNKEWKKVAAWNAIAIDDVVATVSKLVREKKPHLVLSVSSHAGMQWLKGQGTNSVKWANEGLIDLILHIEYSDIPKIRLNLWNKALSELNDHRKIVMMVGNYEKSALDKSNVWPRDANKVNALFSYSLKKNPSAVGYALYEYRFLSSDQIKVLSIGELKTWVPADWLGFKIVPGNLSSE